MPESAFGVALEAMRKKKGDEFSLRVASEAAGMDHAYWYRLEGGEKSNPSLETVDKISKGLTLSQRDKGILEWLAEHGEANIDVIKLAVSDASVTLDEFTAAASIRHRGTVRPDAATLIERVRRILREE